MDAMDDWRAVADGPVMAYALELKRAGIIRHVGVSSHNPQVALEAVRSGLIEVLMFSVNPCYDLLPASEDCEDLWRGESYEDALLNMDPERETLYEACQRAGVGITVMKAFGGGDLLDARLLAAGRALTFASLFITRLPAPRFARCSRARAASGSFRIALLTRRRTRGCAITPPPLPQMPKISWQGRCMYCGHCAPCPKGIDIAAVTKFLALARAHADIPETVRGHYALLKHPAGECIRCGACEKRCPFGVDVRGNMAAARELFGL